MIPAGRSRRAARRRTIGVALAFLLAPVSLVRGASWRSIGPPGGIVASLSFSRSNPSVVYAALVGGGVFRSADGGASWRPSNSGLTNLRVFSVAVDPTHPDVAYAAAFRGGYATGGVFKTIDGGTSWAAANDGLSVQETTVVRIDPGATSTVYTGTLSGGIFRSADGAATWHDVGTGIAAGASVIAMEIDSASNVYASVALSGEGPGAILKSANGGGTWSRADSGLPATDRVSAIASPPGAAGALLAGTLANGVFRSTNGGASWAPSSSGLPPETSIASITFDPADASAAFAGSAAGAIYLSNDGGVHWTPLGNGGPQEVVLSLAVTPSGPRAILAGTSDAGVLRSAGGAAWTPSNAGIRAHSSVTLATDPSREGRVFAAGALGGISTTGDGGSTWTGIDNGLPERVAVNDFDWASEYAAALAADPSAPATLYAGLSQMGPGAEPAGGGLFKSVDGGATWASAAAGITDGSLPISIGHLAIDPLHPSTIFAAAEGRGLFRSTNSASSWARLAGGLPSNAFLNGVAVNPASPSTVFAITSLGLYRSADSGDHWTLSDAGFADSSRTRALAFDSTSPSRVFAGTFRGEFLTSSDGGLSWTPGSAPATDHGINGLIFVPATSALYASTEDAGIFRSADLGSHWSALNDGLPTLRVFTLIASSGGSRLYCGLYGGGVAELDVEGVRPRIPISPAPPPAPAPLKDR